MVSVKTEQDNQGAPMAGTPALPTTEQMASAMGEMYQEIMRLRTSILRIGVRRISVLMTQTTERIKCRSCAENITVLRGDF